MVTVRLPNHDRRHPITLISPLAFGFLYKYVRLVNTNLINSHAVVVLIDE